MSSDFAIKVENVSKCYPIYDRPKDRLLQGLFRGRKQYFREFWALRDVSLEVKKGESVGIIGRNGSGKSTLLQIITGTLSPTSGTVSTNGRIAALLELGSGFNPDFTGRENVYLNGALLGFNSNKIDEKFDDIASFADIGEYIDQPVKTYSSGMLVRLAFAVQVQAEPDILIIDEALSVGDALFQKRCFQKLEQLISEGVSLLFVSHDQESIRTLTKRALLLQHGNVSAWGPSSDVVLEYRRQLNIEETAYYSAKLNKKMLNPLPEGKLKHSEEIGEKESENEPRSKRSDRLSFGSCEVEIINVEVLDESGSPCSIFYSGDPLAIRITCQAAVAIDHLNVAVRIRNKEGVKIYSWGTLNQDMTTRKNNPGDELFWNKHFSSKDVFNVILKCDCPLGTNFYEVQAAVSYEETPDYLSQRIIHWIDEAAFFQVLLKTDEYYFGGVADLRMKADWEVNESGDNKGY